MTSKKLLAGLKLRPFGLGPWGCMNCNLAGKIYGVWELITSTGHWHCLIQPSSGLGSGLCSMSHWGWATALHENMLCANTPTNWVLNTSHGMRSAVISGDPGFSEFQPGWESESPRQVPEPHPRSPDLLWGRSRESAFLKSCPEPRAGRGSRHPQSHTLGCSKWAHSLLSKDALPNSGAAREDRSCVSPAQTHGPPAAQSIRKQRSAL